MATRLLYAGLSEQVRAWRWSVQMQNEPPMRGSEETSAKDNE